MHFTSRLHLFAALVACVIGGHVRADAVDDAVAAQMRRRGIPGVSIAVIEGGAIVKAKGYGFADVGAKTPVTTQTLFQAGSVSKSVAAIGALVLVDAGKLALDEDINQVLRSWRVPDNDFTATEKVTLRRLLSHSAGLTVHGFPGYTVEATLPTLQQILDGAHPANTAAVRVDVVPGTVERYSGGGYVVVQQAVIDVTRMPYAAYQREHVLAPLGMELSTFEQPLPSSRQADTATGYYPGARAVGGRWHVYPELAPAGLWTTPSDLARFAIGIQNALAGTNNAVLSRKTAQLALTPEKNHFGLGFVLSGSGATRRFGHGGRNDGFDTELVAYCEGGRGAVVMVNTNENSQAVRRILDAIADQYHWPDYPHVSSPSAIADTDPAVTSQLKAIFADAAVGKFDRGLYTNELAALVEQQVGAGKPGTAALTAAGQVQKVELLGRSQQKGVRQYRYRFVCERDTLIVICGYDNAGRIAQLGFMSE